MPDINSANINKDVATGRKIKGRETLIKTVSLLSPDHWSGFGLRPVRISWSVPYRYRPIAQMLYAGHARTRAYVVRRSYDLVPMLYGSRPMSGWCHTYARVVLPYLCRITLTLIRPTQSSATPAPKPPVGRISAA